MCVIETTPRIETRRLTLRSPQMDDAARLAELCNDFDISRMTSSLRTLAAISLWSTFGSSSLWIRVE